MKNLFLSFIALSFIALACKKNETESNTTESVNVQNNPPDTASSTSKNSKNSTTKQDSINTKTHIGGRKTSNNNTGNGSGNINAAVSDSLQPTRQKR